MHNFNFNWLILAVCNKSSGMKIRSCFACNQLIENPLSAENTREPLLETNFISVPSSRSRVCTVTDLVCIVFLSSIAAELEYKKGNVQKSC